MIAAPHFCILHFQFCISNPAAVCAKVLNQTDGNSKIHWRKIKMADDKKDEKICKNPPCSCPATEGSKYCGPSCEGTGSFIELDCDCGHEACSGNF